MPIMAVQPGHTSSFFPIPSQKYEGYNNTHMTFRYIYLHSGGTKSPLVVLSSLVLELDILETCGNLTGKLDNWTGDSIRNNWGRVVK